MVPQPAADDHDPAHESDPTNPYLRGPEPEPEPGAPSGPYLTYDPYPPAAPPFQQYTAPGSTTGVPRYALVQQGLAQYATGQYGVAPYGVDPWSGIPYSAKSKTTAGLLQLLLPFVCVCGVGRLYAGHTKIGLIQLLGWFLSFGLVFALIGIPMLIGVWVWSVVDGIVMLTANTRDGNGQPMR